jgi:hypothetical protein
MMNVPLTEQNSVSSSECVGDTPTDDASCRTDLTTVKVSNVSVSCCHDFLRIPRHTDEQTDRQHVIWKEFEFLAAPLIIQKLLFSRLFSHRQALFPSPSFKHSPIMNQPNEIDNRKCLHTEHVEYAWHAYAWCVARSSGFYPSHHVSRSFFGSCAPSAV